jgi:ribosomal protein S27AE
MPKTRFTPEQLKERIRARDRKRGADPKRIAAQKLYQQTPEGREASQRAKAAYYRRYKEKTFARNMVNNALRDGRITKSETCGRCGKSGTLEAHHPDYSKPFEVLWVHDKCHKAIHKEEREARRLKSYSLTHLRDRAMLTTFGVSTSCQLPTSSL